MPKFYLTTPIYYVNARPHIGHAYTTLAADVIARRHRLLGDDTFLLTGTDEHGQKIERSAAIAGIAPQQFADEVSASFEDLWKRMGITNDAFIRTTSDAHKRGAQKLFADLHARGAIYLSSYTGQYSVGEEMFIDGPPGTIGPDGKPTETVTEENFFFKLSDYQEILINLIESSDPENRLLIQPEERKNEVLSFLRGNWVAELRQQIPAAEKERSELGLSNARVEDVIEYIGRPDSGLHGNAKLSKLGNFYIPGALRDLSVSRSSFTWGIPVPEPAASETKQPHVIYVWLDALANYMTALGYGSDLPDDQERFAKYWPADLHLVGKEIIRFHCVYWPAFLLAAGLPLPKAVTAHGWLLFDDAKMSKSKGNIVRTETILDAFGEHVYKKHFPDSTKQEQELFATDVLRYFLLREIPFGQDGSFSFDAMITRYNADLANGYGNLVSRVLKMVETCSSGKIPVMVAGDEQSLQVYEIADTTGLTNIWLGPTDEGIPSLYSQVDEQGTRVALPVKNEHLAVAFSREIDSCRFGRALDMIIGAIRTLNVDWNINKPWVLAKSDKQEDKFKLNAVLSWHTEAIRIVTALLYPVLPYASVQVWSQLGLRDIQQSISNDTSTLHWRSGSLTGSRVSYPFGLPETENDFSASVEPAELGDLATLFPSISKRDIPGFIQIMIDMEAAKSAQAKPALTDEATPAAPEPADSNHPGAAPRTASLPIPNPGATVAGSHALTTERVHTAHTEAAPSGIFAADTSTPQIAIDDFVKVDLRVAQVLVAERIPKADKLLRLEVDLGPDFPKRQILSGIAEWYTPEELIGRRIVIVANLAPRKMRGLESHGMLLAASSGDHTKPILTTFGEDIALGSRVR